MRRIKIITILALVLVLSGCSLPFNDYNSKKSDIEGYNALVNSTLDNYAKSKIYAEENKEYLLEYAFKDSDFSGITGETIETVEPLTEEQLKAFERGRILNDDFFTALGFEGVREVLTLKGSQHIMYVTVVWGAESIISIDRVVVKE